MIVEIQTYRDKGEWEEDLGDPKVYVCADIGEALDIHAPNPAKDACYRVKVINREETVLV